MWTIAAIYLLLLQSPESEHRRAVELAAAGDIEQAKAILLTQQDKNPNDKRFPIELAAIGFKAGNYREARRYIHRALRIDPDDIYANDFNATVYLLQNNAEAALKYWNRIGRPHIENVQTDPEVSIDPVLWDRSFAFSPASTLTLEDFQNTKARLEFLDVLSLARFEFVPVGESFDVVLHAIPRTGGIGSGKLSTVAALARGLPYQTVEFDFRNLRSAGLNVSSLLRWDPKNRLARLRAAGPIQKNPRRRLDVSVDGRNEAWDVSQEEFTIQKLKASVGIESQVNARWSWASRLNASSRKSSKLHDRNGTLLTYEANVSYRFFSWPERRLTMDGATSFEFGRRFDKTTSMASLQWFPQAASDDYKATVLFNFGRVGGTVPFDEYFTLGLDRDHDLLLRGHPGTRDGRKGEGPIGPKFLLWNIDLQKNVLKQGLFTVGVGPFVDVAQMAGAASRFIDTGVQVRFLVLGAIRLDFSYGRDLQAGRNAFFYRSR
jgi:tetratricopeptide (TPR) repeat protein